MMKRICIVLIFSSLILSLVTCTDRERQTPALLSYLRTDYGGCNGYNEGTILPKSVYDSDKLYWEIRDDTLKVFTGVKYICCAPFIIESEQAGDSLTIMIRDTCSAPYHTCYCRCMCYYEFLTMFTGYGDDQYHLSVYLHDPRQSQDSLLWCVEIP